MFKTSIIKIALDHFGNSSSTADDEEGEDSAARRTLPTIGGGLGSMVINIAISILTKHNYSWIAFLTFLNTIVCKTV